MLSIKKSFSIKYIYSAALLFFIIFTGSYSFIGSLRFIEFTLPLIILILLIFNRGIIPFGSNHKIFLIFILSILFFGLYQLNSNSLYAIRLINSLLTCGTMYYLACSQNLFYLYPKYFFIITVCLYSLGIYTYFWEYTYIFSLLLAPLVYSKNYFFALLNVAFLLLIGQRTSILNIGFIVYAIFLNGKLSYARFFGFLIIIISIFLSFSYLDIRALNAFKEISFKDLYLAITSAIDIAGYYSYEEFVFGDGREVLTDGGDLSLHLRFKKWGHAIASSDLYSLFFGLGSGYFGKAADSGWIRLFFEYGLLVFSIFISIIIKLIKLANPLQRLIIGIFIISNMFLDILYSPLLMGFTGIMLGLSRSLNKNVYR